MDDVVDVDVVSNFVVDVDVDVVVDVVVDFVVVVVLLAVDAKTLFAFSLKIFI